MSAEKFNSGIEPKEKEEKTEVLSQTKETETPKPVVTPSNPAEVLGTGQRGGDRWDSGVDVLEEEKNATLPQWNTDATFGIRNSLENDFAIDGSRIGYKDGNVLLDGKFLMKAENNVDGTTYAKDYQTVASNLNNYIKNNGLVAIRDYATASGTAVNIQWNDAEKTVSINGQTIKPTAVIDGKAYIPKSQIDELLTSQRDTAGTSYGNIYNEVMDKHGENEQRAYENYINAEKFKYVPENDPAYRAYMEMAKKAIKDEYDENMAASRFRTGGVASTGQMLQAAAIREGAVDDLKTARAQFEQNAYQRYMDDLALRRDRYEVTHGAMVDDYNLRAGVNAADKQDVYDAYSFDRGMQATEIGLENDKLEYGNNLRNYKISEQFAPILAALEVDNAVLQNVTDRESLRMRLVEYGYTPERINSIMAEIDAFNTYING